jgi:hypothetical protein
MRASRTRTKSLRRSRHPVRLVASSAARLPHGMGRIWDESQDALDGGRSLLRVGDVGCLWPSPRARRRRRTASRGRTSAAKCRHGFPLVSHQARTICDLTPAVPGGRQRFSGTHEERRDHRDHVTRLQKRSGEGPFRADVLTIARPGNPGFQDRPVRPLRHPAAHALYRTSANLCRRARQSSTSRHDLRSPPTSTTTSVMIVSSFTLLTLPFN